MALSNLQSRFSSRAAKSAGAAALALGLTFSPVAADNAYSQDAQAQQVSQTEIRVPMRDARNIERDAIQSGAAIRSNNKQIIVLYGPNSDTFEGVVQGARSSLAANSSALEGVIVASGDPEVAFYADGLLTATIENPQGGAGLAWLVRDQLETDYEKIVQKQLMATSQTLNLNQ